MFAIKTIALFILTAFFEILGCFLPYLWLKRGFPFWVVVPSALCLGLFAWLLTLHPTEAGRTYAAYGGVYVSSAMLWMWWVEGVRPDRWDFFGALLMLAGMAIVILAPRSL
jgi:small multidrug resistance family-3 protein